MQKLTSKLLLLFFVLLSAVVYGQGSTTAAMEGIISNTKGQPLPGALVFATHVPTNTQYATEVREDGRFNIPNMRVGGPYTFEVMAAGYLNPDLKNITLKLGQVFTIKLRLLSEDVTMKEVAVSANRSAVISSGRTGAATNVTNDQIESFPTVARSFQDFAKFTPQFDGKSSGAAGRSSRYNNIQIDGTQYNDLFGLGSSGTPGGTANTNPISLDAIQEFQVVVAPYDVKLSGFTGGGINAITKSGTNTLSGSAYTYYRNQDFVGKSPDSKRTKYADFTELQSGASLGGSIIKDQLFYFVSGEITQRNQPTDNIAISQASDPTALQNTVNIIRDTLIKKYKYNPGDAGSYKAKRPSTKLFARLDYNLDKNNRLTLRHNYVDASNDVTGRSGQYLMFSDATYKMNNTTNSTVLQLNSTFGTTMANEFIFGFTSIRDKRDPASSSFPFIQIKSIPGTSAYVEAGAEQYSLANKLDQDIFELTDNFTYYMGEHTLTFGTHNEMYKFKNLYIANLGGFFTFNSYSDFLTGKVSRYQVSKGINDPMFAADFSALQFGVYAQDEWSLLRNLKLTYGLRVDLPYFPDKPATNAAFSVMYPQYSTDKLPDVKPLFSPRIGFNYDVNDDKSLQVRGGLGLFTGKVPYVWISNQYGNTGVDIMRIDATGSFVFDPTKLPVAGDSLKNFGKTTWTKLPAVKTSEVDITDKKFEMPQLFRMNFAVDQQLIYGLVGTIEAIYSKSINDVYYQNLNYAPYVSKANGGDSLLADGRKLYRKLNTTDFTDIMLMKNTSDGYQYSITAQVQGTLPYGLYTNVAYTYNTAKDVCSNTSSQAASNWKYNPIDVDCNGVKLTTSNYEVKHRLMIAISETFELAKDWKTSISLFYNGQSGLPYSYVYSTDANGDGATNNDLIYVPKNNNDIYLTESYDKTKTAAAQRASLAKYDALFKYIADDDYLSQHRGQIMERNGARAPWVDQLDLKITQDIPLFTANESSTHKLQISLDILNLPNLLDSDWGMVKYVTNQSFQLLKYEGLSSDGKRMFSYSNTKGNPYNNDDLLSRWQMQLGIRYNF